MARNESKKETLPVDRLALALLVSLAFLFVVLLRHHARTKDQERPEYTFRGRDYPETWDIGPLEEVHMPYENTVHYALDTPAGIEQWETMLPPGGGMLYFGTDKQPFSISVFHQLRCLDILRAELVVQFQHADEPPPEKQSPLVNHCMNYIRQTVLCRADLTMESIRGLNYSTSTVSDVTHVCQDHTAVFRAAEEIWKEYERTTWLKAS
ncbi:hypothetical protein GGF50DRAFT_122496 [Schizophyllum commune]